MLAFPEALKRFLLFQTIFLLNEQKKTAEAALIIRCGERDLNPHDLKRSQDP